ncbi:MAG: acetyl-CoA hydrolase/transferase family protein [Deltaproteobacteria bacterium]|nr:acetyl-CoA hydrolase/transferase family protein [Deltaproteobacteria bacterium]
MGWQDRYREKLMSADAAVQLVRSNDRIFCSGNTATPTTLVRALAKRYEELKGVELCQLNLMGEDILARPEMEGHFRYNSLFVGAKDRDAIRCGRADYTPVFLHQIPQLFRSRTIPLDVALVTVTKPDKHGYMSFGVEVIATPAACQSARHVIVQVNDTMSRMLGDTFIHVDEVDAIVEADDPIRPVTPRRATDVELKIGEHIRPLIEHGSTLQMGIGGIPDAVYKALDDVRDLGIHTEMFSDGAMRAVEKGIVTGRLKTLHPKKSIITFAMGSDELYDFVSDNPHLEGHPVEYVNDPFVISRNEKMVAINSAIEVDLSGQVCSDSIGFSIYSGFGGQVDFIRGAAGSKGGKPIIALPSTAAKGTMTRIVPSLKQGAGVVTTRADTQYVVTEYGRVNLFGKNLRQRAEALISIAHPDFRDELYEDARARKILC